MYYEITKKKREEKKYERKEHTLLLHLRINIKT